MHPQTADMLHGQGTRGFAEIAQVGGHGDAAVGGQTFQGKRSRDMRLNIGKRLRQVKTSVRQGDIRLGLAVADEIRQRHE